MLRLRVLLLGLSVSSLVHATNPSREIELCEQKLRQVVCVTSSSESGPAEECASVSPDSPYVRKLMDIARELPEYPRKVLCHLRRIQIHTSLGSGGYVTEFQGLHTGTRGYMMGLKDVFFDSRYNPNQIWTWKEQLNFGLASREDASYSVSERGPHLLAMNATMHPHLFELVVHEIFHVIDFLNDVHRLHCEKAQGSWKCSIRPDSFAGLDWRPNFEWDIAKGRWKKAFPWLAYLCFYDCGSQTLQEGHIEVVYEELRGSPFVTSYSVVSPREDFAEFGLFWTLAQMRVPFKNVATRPDGSELLSAEVQLRSEQNQQRRQWFSQFLSRKDLKFQ